MDIYNEKEQAEQGKIQNTQFEEKRSTMNYIGTKYGVQGDTKFKEKPNAQWDKESGDFRVRPHSSKLLICGNELKKEKFNQKAKHHQQKDDTNVSE